MRGKKKKVSRTRPMLVLRTQTNEHLRHTTPKSGIIGTIDVTDLPNFPLSAHVEGL